MGEEGKMGGDGTPCCGDALGVDGELMMGFEDFEEELVGGWWLA